MNRVIFLTALFLCACGNIQQNDSTKEFTSISDTSWYFKTTSIDSINHENLRHFILKNSHRIGLGYSTEELDSVFYIEKNLFKDFQESQKMVSIDIVEGPFSPNIKITNESDFIIDAMRVRIFTYDEYRNEIETYSSSSPGYIEKRGSFVVDNFLFNNSLSNRKEKITYIVCYVDKIAFSEGKNVQDKLIGRIYDFSDYSIPEYYIQESGINYFGINID